MEDQNLATIRLAIRESSDEFEKHFANSDAEALVANYYVQDPVMSTPDLPMLRGRPAIVDLFKEIMKGFETCRLEQVEVYGGEDLSYELSRALLTPVGGGEVTECRYMIAWRNTSSGWCVEADFFAWGALT